MDSFSEGYWHYFTQTPWYNEIFLRRVLNVISNMEENLDSKIAWCDVIEQL